MGGESLSFRSCITKGKIELGASPNVFSSGRSVLPNILHIIGKERRKTFRSLDDVVSIHLTSLSSMFEAAAAACMLVLPDNLSLRRPDRFRLFACRQECDSCVPELELPDIMDPNGFVDEKSESRIYIGNLDPRITEAALIKMFSPFGKIITEDFLWHTRGRKRGEPRGFAFIQYSGKEEARLAKEKMHGRLACGRPLVVRVSSEKHSVETAEISSKGVGEATKTNFAGSSSGQMSRSAKIAAIKNKLKALEEEGFSAKKQKQADTSLQDSAAADHRGGKRITN